MATDGTGTSLVELWRSGGVAQGAWLFVPSAVSAEAVAHAGFDYVCIDAQHGAIDYGDCRTMIQAILLGGSRPIVRVPWNEPGIIGKVLDAGAHGVIVPMVNSVDEARAVVRACRYAPDGSRSYGPSVIAPRHDDYVEWAREHVAVIPMIETTEALAYLDEILAVDGIDAVYVGPADLSLTLGLPPTNNDDDERFVGALESVVAACQDAGVVPGIHASGALAASRRRTGFRMITVATDVPALRRGLAAELAAAEHDGGPDGGGSVY